MPAYDPECEGDGRYLMAFIESAGEVSTVFERKLRSMAEERFDTLAADEWYRLGDMADLYQQVEDEVGEATMRQGGAENARAIPWPDDLNSVEDGLAFLNEAHENATRGSDREYPAGRYTIEMQGERSVRFGVTEAFPWPASFAEGAIQGIVSDLGPADARTSVTETATNSEERAAWEVTW
jgi:hypothetical protein